MMARVERSNAPLKRVAPLRRRKNFAPAPGESDRELALAYSNGYVTVEISQAALDAYIEMNGDVPLPIVADAETGDRRTYDARNRVRVVYDAEANVREISTRSSEGLFVRINFTNSDPRLV
jgi:hypothetical protein